MLHNKPTKDEELQRVPENKSDIRKTRFLDSCKVSRQICTRSGRSSIDKRACAQLRANEKKQSWMKHFILLENYLWCLARMYFKCLKRFCKRFWLTMNYLKGTHKLLWITQYNEICVRRVCTGRRYLILRRLWSEMTLYCGMGCEALKITKKYLIQADSIEEKILEIHFIYMKKEVKNIDSFGLLKYSCCSKRIWKIVTKEKYLHSCNAWI